MDTKDTIKLYKSDSILLSDSNYYKFIFKKTEKIVCVVFYVLEHADKGQKDMVASAVLESAKRTLDTVLQTLSCRWYTAHDALYAFLNTLIALESTLHVAQAVALVQEEIADLLSLEIETVQRALRQYLSYEKNSAPDLLSFSGIEAEHRVSAHAAGIPRTLAERSTGSSRKTVPETAQNPGEAQTQRARDMLARPASLKGQPEDRRRLIKDILASNRQATIKDISQKLPQYSEKTVQREILNLINQGIIKKEGEKRWTRYSLTPGA